MPIADKWKQIGIDLPSLLPLQPPPQVEGETVNYLQGLHNYLAGDRQSVVRALNVLGRFRLLVIDEFEDAFEAIASNTLLIDATTGAQYLDTDRETDGTTGESKLKPLVPEFASVTGEPTGFISSGDSGTTYKSIIGLSGSNFYIEPDGDSFLIYHSGTKFEKTSTETIDLTPANAEGNWFIYYDSNGNLVLDGVVTFEDVIRDNIFVCELYHDGSSITFAMDERHGLMPWQSHLLEHIGDGATYRSGFGLIDLVTDQAGNADVDAEFHTAAGVFLDEDINHSLSGQNGNWDILSRVSNAWVFENTGAHSPVKLVTAVPQWNDVSGAGVLTPVTNTKYFLMHVFATNIVLDSAGSAMNGHVAIVGQAEYATKPAARIGANTELGNLITVGLPTPEYIPIGTVIYQRKGSNAYNCATVTTDTGEDYVSWLGAEITPGSPPSSHANLTNRDDPDQHPASSVSTLTTNFDGLLTPTEDTVQKALDVLDDHLHDDRYYTETEIDNALALYYTKVELDAGQLDNRYYTETEVDNIAALYLPLAGGSMAGDVSMSVYDFDFTTGVTKYIFGGPVQRTVVQVTGDVFTLGDVNQQLNLTAVDSYLQYNGADVLDGDALHSGVVGEINAISGEVTLDSADVFVFEDFTASWAKKSIDWANMLLTIEIGIGLSDYLPLTAGAAKPLSGVLYAKDTTIDSQAIILSAEGSGNRQNNIDFVSDDSYDYGLRVTRASGVNGSTAFYHRGTGNLNIWGLGASSIRFYTSNDLKFEVAAGGDVTVEKGNLYLHNTTSPSIFLAENGSAIDYFQILDSSIVTAQIIKVAAAGIANIDIEPRPGDGTSAANIRLFRGTNTTEDSSLNVFPGDGTTSPNHSIVGGGDVDFNQLAGDLITGGDFYAGTSFVGSELMKVNGAGSGNRHAAFELHGDDANYGFRVERLNTGANALTNIYHRGTANLRIKAVEAAQIKLYTTNLTRLIISAGGNVTIGSAGGTQKLNVATGHYGADNGYGYRAKNTGGAYITLATAESGGYRALIGSTSGRLKLQSVDGALVPVPTSAISDANHDAGYFSFWVDESGHTLNFKVKYSGGTVKSGSIALT